jgi:hypothetical protein
MCEAPGCDSEDPPPLGQKWCLRRMEVEYERWLNGQLVAGRPRLVARMLEDDPAWSTEDLERLRHAMRELDEGW